MKSSVVLCAKLYNSINFEIFYTIIYVSCSKIVYSENCIYLPGIAYFSIHKSKPNKNGSARLGYDIVTQ
jgi:hypothetical protein